MVTTCLLGIYILDARNIFGDVRGEASGGCGVLHSCIVEEIVEDAELDCKFSIIFFSIVYCRSCIFLF